MQFALDNTAGAEQNTTRRINIAICTKNSNFKREIQTIEFELPPLKKWECFKETRNEPIVFELNFDKLPPKSINAESVQNLRSTAMPFQVSNAHKRKGSTLSITVDCIILLIIYYFQEIYNVDVFPSL